MPQMCCVWMAVWVLLMSYDSYPKKCRKGLTGPIKQFAQPNNRVVSIFQLINWVIISLNSFSKVPQVLRDKITQLFLFMTELFKLIEHTVTRMVSVRIRLCGTQHNLLHLQPLYSPGLIQCYWQHIQAESPVYPHSQSYQSLVQLIAHLRTTSHHTSSSSLQPHTVTCMTVWDLALLIVWPAIKYKL